MGKIIKALFKSGDDSRLLGALNNAVMDKWGPGVEDDMSPEIRIFALVDCAYGSASNGGIRAFLEESLNDFEETIAAFETIGATESVEYLRRVGALFPEGRIPKGDLSEEQETCLEREDCKIFPADVVPELATWVRARSKAFVDLPESRLHSMYTSSASVPILEPPPDEAGSQDMAAWLHSRGVTLTCAEVRDEDGTPRPLSPSHGLPDGPLTLLEARFAYGQHYNRDTLSRLSRWIGRGSFEEMRFEECRLGTAELSLASSFPSLRGLDLKRARFPIEGLRSLVDATSLETLDLSELPVADEDLRLLAMLPNLHTLSLVSTRVQGRSLPLFRGLRQLDLGGPLEDRSLSFLDRLDRLTSLNLYYVPLSPDAIGRIAARPGLEKLLLWDSGLEESALKPLRGHPSLRSLCFQGMTVTATSVEIFAEIPRLEEISFRDIRKPEEMLDRLRKLRPSIRSRE